MSAAPAALDRYLAVLPATLIPIASILSSLALLETACTHAVEPTNEKTA